MNTVLKALVKTRFEYLFGKMLRAGKKKQSHLGKLGMLILFVYVIGIFSFLFGTFFSQIIEPFHMLGIDWFYFMLALLSAFVLMFIGTIFMTQSQLYEANDNELLLAMPIKPAYILISRMIMLYVFNAVYEFMVMLPAIYVYVSNVGMNAVGIVGAVVTLVLLPGLSLAFSALGGYLIAKVNQRIRNKSLFTVVFYLIFLGAYFYFYSRINVYINALITNGEALAGKFGNVTFLYWYGAALSGEGIIYVLLSALCSFVPFAVVYYILTRTFINIATTKRGMVKVKYQAKEMKVASMDKALFNKEAARFFGTPMYLLNCGLGSIFVLVGAVFMIFKKTVLLQFVTEISEEITNPLEILAIGMAFALCLMDAMGTFTAPSISLEGKNLWILKSSPCSPMQIFMAKIKLQSAIQVIPNLIFIVVFVVLFRPSVLAILYMILLSTLCAIMCAYFGILYNLKFPRFDWLTEVNVIKQSISVLFTMLTMQAIVIAPALIYFLVLEETVSMSLYVFFVCIVYAVIVFILMNILKKWGCKKFLML